MAAGLVALVLGLAVPFGVMGPKFILDDWFTVYFRTFQGVLWSGGHGQLAARPGAWLTYLLEFGLVGPHPLAIYAIQTCLNAAIAVALFRLARRFVPSASAMAIAVVWVILQDHSSVDHWASTTPSQVSLLLLLLGGLSLVTATDDDRRGGVAVALFVLSALAYEATLPVAATALFAVPWLRRRRIPWATAGAQLVPLVATGGWMLAHTQHHEHAWFGFSLVYPAHFGWGITPTRSIGQVVGAAFAVTLAGLAAAYILGRRGPVTSALPLIGTGVAVIVLGTLAFARDPIDPIGLGDRANVVASIGAACVWAALGLLAWQWRRVVGAVAAAAFVGLSLTARVQRDLDYARAGQDTIDILAAIGRTYPVPPAGVIVVGPAPVFHHNITGLIGEIREATDAYTHDIRYVATMAKDGTAFRSVPVSRRLDYRPFLRSFSAR